eukprot:g12915.t1
MPSQGAGGGTAVVSEKSSSPSTSLAGDGFQGAASTMMGGTCGEVLEDGAMGTNEAREAKIEETLRNMGVQSIGEVRAGKAKTEMEMEEERTRTAWGGSLPLCSTQVRLRLSC